MSSLSPKRLFLCVLALLSATSAFASFPSARSLARMAYDEREEVTILFGGRGTVDAATTSGLHASDETWFWNGGRWLQQYPATKPPARSAHNMVYDSKNGRVVMFGGRVEAAERAADATFLNDLWAYENGNWIAIDGSASERPAPRQNAGMAYDRARDRFVVYGGSRLTADGVTLENLFDTWEFDGTNWTKVSDAPEVLKPLLAYDINAGITYMIALSSSTTGESRLMYRYDAAAHAWVALAPTAMPTCVNEGYLIYRHHTQKLLFLGGLCTSGTPNAEEAWEYDRAANTWTKTTTNAINRGVAQAVSYDTVGGTVVQFGGTVSFAGGQTSITTLLKPTNQFASPNLTLRPTPRSLAGFQSDPARGTIWLYGGLDESTEFYNGDFWSYRAGAWSRVSTTGGPTSGCQTPLAAFDSDRAKLVVVCSGTDVHEWDGTEWKSFTTLSKEPSARFYGGLAYDPNLKKTILFGGYALSNYRHDTWTWNGTEWAELDIRNNQRPPHRGLFAMWYDPLQKKVLLYGGLGRGSVNERITRYSDMWSFNGTAWTKIETTTPGTRFGPQIAVNPTTGKLLLFGGLRAETIDEDSIRQFFDNDTWEWDGAAGKWTELDPATLPDPRENGSMTWDPVTGQLVMFGGYANGFFRSDIWAWNGTNWVVRPEPSGRGRSVRH
ncbi:MAG TPA: kelch repeat-containing protein [Thermoanaerobaculia bacterium]|nr:kelch repeat-containing protein [Thermoanaerobaculia bacterium]